MAKIEKIVDSGRENTPLYHLHVGIHDQLEAYEKEHGEISAIVMILDKNKDGEGSFIGNPQKLAHELFVLAAKHNAFLDFLGCIMKEYRKL